MPAQKWLQASDSELLDACRQGETEAFSLIWDRHHRAALAAARGIAPTLDADDLVSEAYLRIFELTVDGRGPRGAFRPYIYQVIRSVAVDRLRSPEQASDDLDQIPDLHETGPWEDNAFDRNAVAAAFSTLNERWQAALWYTEVEGMPPREASTLLGISANSVSALAIRARDALKSAWVEAHMSQQLTEAACQSTRRGLQRYQRGKLTSHASREVEAHLDECETCASIAAEFSMLNRQLGLVLGTIFLGGVATAAIFSELGIASTPTAVALDRVAGRTGKPGIKAAAAGGAAASSGIGATVAMASGLTVAALAVLGGATLVISSLVLPHELASRPEIHTESTDDVVERDVSAASTDDVKTVNEAEESSEQPDGISDEIIAPIGRTSTSASQPSPVRPEPINPPPVTPPPPVVEGDPALAVFDVCRSQYYPPEYFVLEGSSVEHGVVQGRITQGLNVANIPVDFDEFTPPINPGDPWRWSSTHQSTYLISLTPLSTWGLENDDISNVTVELRFIADDDRYSPWVPLDSSVSC